MSVLDALRVTRIPSRAFVVVGIYWGAFAAYVPEIKARIGVGDAAFGMVLLGSAFGLVSAMWLAPRVDRILGAEGMRIAALLLAVAFLLPGSAGSAPALFGAMALAGVASGLTDVVMNARVSELEAAEGKSLMNASHGAFSAAYAVSALTAGLAREAGVPPVAMFAALGLVTMALSLGLRMAPAVLPEDAPAPAGRSQLLIVAICGLVVLVAFMTEATVESWSALFIERELGGSAAEGALGPAMLGLTMAVGRFSGQVATGRFRETSVVLAAGALSMLGLLTAAAAPAPFWAYLGFAVLGLGISVIGPLGLAMAGQLVAPRERTTAIARAAVMGFSGFFIAPVLMGGLSELFGLRVAFLSVAGLLLLLPPLVAVIRRWKPGI